MKILILGKSGMLGSMVYKNLSNKFDVVGLGRGDIDVSNVTKNVLQRIVEPFDWVINCIGIIKHNLDESVDSWDMAIKVNSVFPLILGTTGKRVIQIETDCVYDGSEGKYTERKPHDAIDVYGKTKSLGEFPFKNVIHLRTSIIGPGNPKALMDWFLSQSEVTGYANHFWNGITTLQFAKLCEGIISSNYQTGFTQHIVPGDWVTKYRLLRYINEIYGKDIKIILGYSEVKINRLLNTINVDRNSELWKMAGYKNPPIIREMIQEMRNYE